MALVKPCHMATGSKETKTSGRVTRLALMCYISIICHSASLSGKTTPCFQLLRIIIIMSRHWYTFISMCAGSMMLLLESWVWRWCGCGVYSRHCDYWWSCVVKLKQSNQNISTNPTAGILKGLKQSGFWVISFCLDKP